MPSIETTTDSESDWQNSFIFQIVDVTKEVLEPRIEDMNQWLHKKNKVLLLLLCTTLLFDSSCHYLDLYHVTALLMPATQAYLTGLTVVYLCLFGAIRAHPQVIANTFLVDLDLRRAVLFLWVRPIALPSPEEYDTLFGIMMKYQGPRLFELDPNIMPSAICHAMLGAWAALFVVKTSRLLARKK